MISSTDKGVVIEAKLNDGKMHLMKMDWTLAENDFYEVLKITDQSEWMSNEVSQYDWMKVEALSGLGETEMRRCRRFCYGDLTWFRGMVRSLAFYNEALYYVNKRNKIVEGGNEKKTNNIKKEGNKRASEECRGNYEWAPGSNGGHLKNNDYKDFHQSSFNNKLDPRNDPQINAFFNQIEPKIKYQIKSIEDNTNKTLTENILKNCLATCSGKTISFNNDWLKQLVLFCGEERNIRDKPTNMQESLITSSKTLNSNQKSENFQPVYKRKIDFDRVQEAIMQMVNDVSIDVRRHYSHMNQLVPQTLLQQRLMREVTRRLNPGQRDNPFLEQVLDNFVVYEENDKGKKTSNGGLSETQIDEEEDTHETIYMNVEPSRFDDMKSVITSRDPTRASSPSCLSKRSQHNRVFQQMETASVGKFSQTTCAKTISSKRSGLPMYEVYDMPSKSTRMKNILTVWRSHKPKGSVSGVSSCASSFRKQKYYTNLQTFEEVSPLTEREKVLNWLQSLEESSHQTSPVKKSSKIDKKLDSKSHKNKTSSKEWTQNEPKDVHVPYHQLSKQKLNYTLAVCVKKAADSLGKTTNYSEALEVYKFSLDVLKSNSTGLRSEKELTAELLRNIGMTKCSLGQISVGCQLMKESVGIYSKLENERDSSKISEVWFQLGGAFLSEELRKDSLFLRTMQLIQKELNSENKVDILNSDDDKSYKDDDSEISDGNSDKEEGYCVCIYEAMECYKQSLNLFINLGQNGLLLNTELYIHVLCNLADCYFMAGNMDLAEVYYEEALLLFPRARGNPIMQENSHVLSMLGSLNFLLGNYTRSATMYETSQILNQHKKSTDTPSLQQAWNLAMLGISYYHLGHFDKSIAWCTKAFSLYTRVLRGALFNADFYNHWFVIENLYSLGTAYGTMNFFDKGIYYLKLGNRLIKGCEVVDRQDTKQHVKVLRALGDSHASIEDSEIALKFYEEAVEVSKQLGENNTKTALQNQLHNSMAYVNVDGKDYNSAGNNLEKALDYQKDMELSIKIDMVAVMKRLGATSVLACDIDKAIGCYKDCIQACRELHWMPQQAEEISELLCTLAILYHVKSCTLDDENQMELFMIMSEGCFQEAIAITEENVQDISKEVERSVDIQYANYLFQQGLYADALQTILPVVFLSQQHKFKNLVFNGIEQAVLPDHFQSDFHDDCMSLDSEIFSYFLALLCYKCLGLMSGADDVLVKIYAAALSDESSAFLCNICAYAMMEMSMFKEACQMFYDSAVCKDMNSSYSSNTNANYWICLCVYVYNELVRIHDNIYFRLFRRHSTKPQRFSGNSRLLEISQNRNCSSSKNENLTESDLEYCSASVRSDTTETWEEWTEEVLHVPSNAQFGNSKEWGLNKKEALEEDFNKNRKKENGFEEKRDEVSSLDIPFNYKSNLENYFAEDIHKQQQQHRQQHQHQQQQHQQQQQQHQQQQHQHQQQQHQQQQHQQQQRRSNQHQQHTKKNKEEEETSDQQQNKSMQQQSGQPSSYLKPEKCEDSDEEVSESYSEEIVYGLPFAHKFHIPRADSQNTLTSSTGSPRSSSLHTNKLLSPAHNFSSNRNVKSVDVNKNHINFRDITSTSTSMPDSTAKVVDITTNSCNTSGRENIVSASNNNYKKQLVNDQHNRANNVMTLEINGNHETKNNTCNNQNHFNSDNKTSNSNITSKNINNRNTSASSSSNNIESDEGGNRDEEFFEEWVTYEEVVDTPMGILTILNSNRLLAAIYFSKICLLLFHR